MSSKDLHSLLDDGAEVCPMLSCCSVFLCARMCVWPPASVTAKHLKM